MEDTLNSIIAKIEASNIVKYVDEDWGQLDYFSPNFPVKWPCVLIDISNANFDDIGKDRTASPINRQTADTMVSLTFANLKLTNSSGRAPQLQRDQAFSIWKLQQDIHELLHGWNPTQKTSKLIRTGMQRVKRDDGVQEYTVMYSLGMTNI